MQLPQPSYTVRNLFYEYLMFLVGALFVGGMVAWAQIPHGVRRAIFYGGSTMILSVTLATIGFVRRRVRMKQYLQAKTNSY
ncbi:hypothetical protein ACOALA_17625 [Alicyclobacillus acidoterrestris]|uniref:hypothetical protein n=1 Tax=Alicyclobacillus acidoterrestris TaxID=1450 RepID=UPI003F53A1EC